VFEKRKGFELSKVEGGEARHKISQVRIN